MKRNETKKKHKKKKEKKKDNNINAKKRIQKNKGKQRAL